MRGNAKRAAKPSGEGLGPEKEKEKEKERERPGRSRRERPSRKQPDPTLPLVALVGRPNVGKSSLFNRLVGGRPALVEDMPGVTRDRRYGEADWGPARFRVVDTGGLDPSAEGILGAMRQQIAARAATRPIWSSSWSTPARG